MPSEKTIKNVLDLLTIAPSSQIESLRFGAVNHTLNMKNILHDKNVVAVGIGEKISGGKKTGKLALMFYVEKKIPLKNLRGNQVIPPTVPESVSGAKAVPTDVIAIGKIRPEVRPNVTRKPLQPGNSVGHVDVGAGTLGAIVTDGTTKYILSNSHVLANSGQGKKGDDILYPGEADGGLVPKDLVANLVRFIPFAGKNFVNHVDCAIAKPLSARLPELTPDIKGIGIPKGTITAKRGMKIIKVGRTTGKTRGEVKDVHFRFVLTYDGTVGDVGYIDQVWCTRYSKPGDSGALVLDQKTGKAVGLHFAGANGGSVFNPIDEVLSALKVKLVTAHAVKKKNKKT